jgi:hypothetical protein
MKIRMRHSIQTVAVLTLTLLCGTTHADLKSTRVARYDAAVAKAVSFLQTMPAPAEREKSLVAYALLKAGVDLTDPRLSSGIADAGRRGTACRYDGYGGAYLAAVDAMLLVDIDGKKYQQILQKIADLIVSYQRSDGSWGDPSLGPDGAADTSLTQYCVLGLWAAVRAECKVSPGAFDKVASFLAKHSNPDGGWTYRVTGPTGQGTSASRPTTTVAAVSSLGIARLLLRFERDDSESPKQFGVLERSDMRPDRSAFKNYSPAVSLEALDASISRGVNWNEVRFSPVPPAANHMHLLYFYYAIERAAALVEMRDDWYTVYGDGLLTIQHSDGHFDGFSDYGSAVGTSFAILYYMRSTQQILDYGKGIQVGSRDLVDFLHPKSQSKKEIGPLDDLLAAMEGKDFSELDVNTDDIVEKIQFSSRDELIGQGDKLKTLLKSPDATNRQIAYWALSRTGDFDLVPLMLDGINDPVLSVNVEALTGLRYISRKPDGFKLSLDPLSGLPDDAGDEKRLNAIRVWRDKASRLWRAWYSRVRPYTQRDGLDEIGLPFD